MISANRVNREEKKKKHDKQMTFQQNEAISHNCTSKWWFFMFISIRRFTCLYSDPEFDIINLF